MFTSAISGYLSQYKGTEVDAAVKRVQGLNAEFAEKVDKTTTINNIPLDTDSIVITAENIGALPLSTRYGRSLSMLNGVLYLLDQNGVNLSSKGIPLDDAKWGKILGDISDQTDLQNALNAKQDEITSVNMLDADLVDDTSSVHKFATAAQLTQIGTNQTDIATINGKIPSAATSSNQLADKNYVNSAIQTASSYFDGAWDTYAAIPTTAAGFTNAGFATPTLNNYLVVLEDETQQGGGTWRYKYISDSTVYDKANWSAEYRVNESPFTSDEWAAIDSGITSSLVEQIGTNQSDISTINSTIGNYGNIVTHNVNEFATAAQGALADTALQSINSTMVVNALGYTPYNSTNPAGYISSAAISSLTDVTLTSLASGEMLVYDSTSQKWKNGSITSSDVTTALGYTPYDSTNPSGYISGISSSDVTTALGYTPYNSTNPAGYISSAAISSLTDVSLSSLASGETLVYNSSNSKWENKTINSAVWGNISGTLSDQTDLQTALNGKQDTVTGAATTVTSNNLTTGRALVSDTSGKIAVSSITTTKLGYLSDVSSNIQSQLNNKYDSSNPSGYISSAAISSLTDVTLGTLANRNVLIYDSTTAKWENGTLTSSDVTTALGYTPYDSTNPDGFISGITSSDVTTALGFTPYDSTNPDGFISGITSSDVTTALGYTPYSSTNPAGYISGISSSDVTTALGFTPYDSTNPAGYISGISSSDVTTALGYTPYDSTNPAGYISGISGTDVTTALGFIPYNSTNPSGYISSAAVSSLTDVSLSSLVDGQTLVYDSNTQKWKNAASGGSTTLSDLTDVDLTNPTQGQNLTYDAINSRWINSSTSATVGWGGITGTLSDQTDLQNALNAKASVTIRDWSN